jgi:predicted Zn-dependent peptidase
MFPKFYNYKLDNGIQIVLIPIANTKNIATSLTFDVGYLEETKKEDGLAHLTEHIISRYITNYTKVKDIKSKGHYVYTNAHTNHFKTDYHIYSLKKNLTDILDSYLTLYDFNRTDRNIFYKEMGAVIVELKQIISNKDKYVFYKNMPELVFGKSGIMVNDPVSEIKNLLKIGECDLISFVRKYYTPTNSVITIAGDFNKTSILKYLKSKFEKIDSGIKRPKRLLTIPNSTNPKYNFELSSSSKLNNLYLNFTFPSNKNNKSLAILQILKKILVELNDSSILFDRLRSKLGVIYSPSIKKYINKHYGILSINYNIETKNYEKGFEELITILNELKIDKIDQNLFELSKNKIMYEISLAQNDKTPKEFLYLTNSVLSNKELLNPLEFYNKYTKHITLNDIRKWCRSVFVKNNSYLCIVGAEDKFKEFSIKHMKRLN